MGVPGLWDVIQPVGQSRSLMNLATVDGFEHNASGRRAYRIGIDASIWFQHSYSSREGENPQLRLLFFRLCKLNQLPLLPLFVFDGRERPKVKRGSRKGKSGSHALTDGFKQMLDHFGYEWRVAFGEAEAELAHLNQMGIIDAILTDDVDAFIFGAKVVIKNWSKDLSGNKSKPATNAEGKVSKHHVMVFSSDDFTRHPGIGITPGGLILFALLKGGDYDAGIPGVGEKIAHSLARAGFGDTLLTAFLNARHTPHALAPFLAQWRHDLTIELRTNARGFLPHRCPSVAIPADFPDLDILAAYAAPLTSGSRGGQGGGMLRDPAYMNVPRIARFCEDMFEWGWKKKILYRFRTVLWEGCVMHVLRRAALEVDEREKTRRIESGEVVIRGALAPAVAEGVGTGEGVVNKYLSLAGPTGTSSASSSGSAFGNSVEERRRAAFLGSARRNQAAAQNPTAAAPTSASNSNNNPLLTEIVSTRQHTSTDNILEYRVVLSPSALVALASSQLSGKRPEPAEGEGEKEQEVDPRSALRMWVPAVMVRMVCPGLVEEYEMALREKGRKRMQGRRAAEADSDEEGEDEEEDEEEVVAPAPKRRRAPRNTNANDVRFSSPVRAPTRDSSQRDNPMGTAASQNVAGPSTSTSRTGQPNPGFLFTFTNPDDSYVLANNTPDRFDLLFDQMIASDSEFARVASTGASGGTSAGAGTFNAGAGVLDRFDMLFDQMTDSDPRLTTIASASTPSGGRTGATASVSITSTSHPDVQPVSRQSKPAPTRTARNKGKGRATQVTATNDFENLRLDFDQFGAFDDPSDSFNQMFDRIMTGSKSKSKAARAKKSRQSAPAGSGSYTRGRRKKTTTAPDMIPVAAPPPPLLVTALPAAVPAASTRVVSTYTHFPDLPPMSSTVRSGATSTVVSRATSTAASDGDVIEIMSGSDDDSALRGSFERGKLPIIGRYAYPEPSSSQDSGFSRYDGEVDIDLTV